jgi:hypothetical protein
MAHIKIQIVLDILMFCFYLPTWEVPRIIYGWVKRIRIERYFGKLATNRLILTQRKGLNIGEYLVDDRTWNGAGEF